MISLSHYRLQLLSLETVSRTPLPPFLSAWTYYGPTRDMSAASARNDQFYMVLVWSSPFQCSKLSSHQYSQHTELFITRLIHTLIEQLQKVSPTFLVVAIPSSFLPSSFYQMSLQDSKSQHFHRSSPLSSLSYWYNHTFTFARQHGWTISSEIPRSSKLVFTFSLPCSSKKSSAASVAAPKTSPNVSTQTSSSSRASLTFASATIRRQEQGLLTPRLTKINWYIWQGKIPLYSVHTECPRGIQHPYRLYQYLDIDISSPRRQTWTRTKFEYACMGLHCQTYKYWATNTYSTLYNIVKSTL